MSNQSYPKLAERAAGIEMLLLDVDGVMTDGLITLDNNGIESKSFHVRDGMGITLWNKAGKNTAIITGRNSSVVELRAQELGITCIRQGIENKLMEMTSLLPEFQITTDQVCYIGDDIPDLPVLEKVGLSVAVADSSPAIHHSVDWLTQNPGGRGAVREVIDFILQIQGYDLTTLYSCDQSQPIS